MKLEGNVKCDVLDVMNAVISGDGYRNITGRVLGLFLERASALAL